MTKMRVHDNGCTPICPLAHSTHVVELTKIAITAKPLPQKAEQLTFPVEVGRVVEGQNCPRCGHDHGAREREGINFWYCCFSLCTNCSDTHVVSDADMCHACGRCPERCECFVCTSCDEKTSHGLCDECDECGDCCECYSCEGCGSKSKYGYCSHCSCCEGCCSCLSCANCGDYYNNGCECGCCSDCCTCEQTEGQDSTTPWAQRGQLVSVSHRSIDHDVWKSVDPVQSMADFYLLSYMMPSGHVGVDYTTSLSVICKEADEARARMVEVLDPIFAEYVDMAIGGELRHHASIRRGKIMSARRDSAWGQWFSIRDQVGPQSLLDAADMFEQMNGGYGGTPWATAARVLHGRITGTIPPWMFVDRVFTMEHNNGSLLNKVEWGSLGEIAYSTTDFCRTVGAAHSAEDTDLRTLLLFANSYVRSLFKDWWKARNMVRVSMNERPLILPTHRDWVRKSSYGETIYSVGEHGQHIALAYS